MRRTTPYEGGVYDKRPCVGEGFVKGKTYGVYVDNAKNVKMTNFRVRFQNSYPFETYAGDIFGMKCE